MGSTLVLLVSHHVEEARDGDGGGVDAMGICARWICAWGCGRSWWTALSGTGNGDGERVD
jgi:hypothetical protein